MQGGQIGWLAQQFDVRVPANDATGGTGCIQQYQVIGLPAPPCLRLAGITLYDTCGQAQPLQVFLDAWQALRVYFHRIEAALVAMAFQDMASFTARGCAGIQNTVARLRCQQGSDQLGGFVLDAAGTFGEARQCGDIAGLLQLDANVTEVTGLCRDPLYPQ